MSLVPASALFRRARRACMVLLLGLAATACYPYHIYQFGGPDGREMGNQPATEWQQRRLNAWLWGIVRQDLAIENSRFPNGQALGIEELKVETNFGYILISAFTLGIWVPVDVSWRVAKPPVQTGTLQ